jgi:hypothetical protein
MRWLSERFARNPFAWILLGLLSLSVWFHYHTGADLRQVCEHFSAFMSQPPFRRDAIPEIQKAEIGLIERLCSSHDF